MPRTNMKLLGTAPGLAAALTLLALPVPAGAQYVVPSGNSAVNQYTETIPTSGGGRDSDRAGGRQAGRTPTHVLGKRKADKLEAQGPVGKAVAETAAATAPVETTAAAPADTGSQTSNVPDGKAGQGDSRGSSDSSSLDGSSGRTENRPPAATTELPDGSSGLAEVLAQATGSTSSGQTGLLLPLVILAALAWAFGFAWRQRQHVG
ncbi:MAG TPA: hypothetical protein VFT19_12385 [Solirubrobacterales bacterium]|nr:hypothetical protein [Solirubrobacterales bacterium]